MGIFSRKEAARIGILDIRAKDVAFGYAHRQESGKVVVCFSAALPIEQRDGEDAASALLRTIEIACDRLVTEGAPLLKQGTGSGKADSIIMQIAAPWQHTVISKTVSAFEMPTSVNSSLISSTVMNGRSQEHEDELVEEIVLSTTLNGYAVKEPIGKQASSIACVVMRSYVSAAVRTALQERVKAHFHSTPLIGTASESTMLEMVPTFAPFHADLCIIAIDEYGTTLLLMQGSALVANAYIPLGTHTLLEKVKHAHIPEHAISLVKTPMERNAQFAETSAAIETAWATALFENMREGIKPFAMPHAAFLISQRDSQDFIIRMLQQAPLKDLWVAGVEPAITPLLQTAFAKHISFSMGEPDLGITLISLRYLSR